MARSIWSGSLSFGLVNVPVGMYSATQDKTVSFRQFQRGTSSRIRYRRVNEDTGEEVPYSEIVKGAEVGDGQYVLLTPEELEEIEPGRSRTIDISDFVDAEEIDPIYYQKTYYLAPQNETGQRAYGLLVQALTETDKVGIATFVMRSKQYLAAVRPKSGVLTLEKMFFADEVRNPVEEIDELPASPDLRKRDLDMAVSLIESMTAPWKPENYRDTYRERVEQLIEAKLNDEEVVSEQPPPEEGKVVDLVAALQASIERARGGHTAGNAGQAQQRLPTRKATERRASASAADSGADARGNDLEGMSKADLYDLAQELDIPGRSKMNRDVLAAAVRQARSSGGRKAS